MNTSRSGASRPKVSVAMIVRDEHDRLAETLESVRALADEIVVLDTGSTDRTVERATELGATVHKKPWANDFAAARNHCQRFLSGSWVLWVNAGEVLQPDGAVALRELLDAGADGRMATAIEPSAALKPAPPIAYSLWIESPASEVGGSSEQRTELRLLPTSQGLRFVGRVRESIALSLGAKSNVTTNARILRQCARTSHEQAAARADRDLALATREAESGGGWTARLALAAGESQSVLGRLDEAREMFRRVLGEARATRAERLEAHYGLLSTFDADPEMHASQLTACLDALEAFPFDSQLLLALGNYMLVRERLDLAIRALDAAVRFGEVTESVWHLREVREIAAICLSSALQLRQDDASACVTLEAALEKNPQSTRVAAQLVPVYRKLGRIEQADTLVARFAFASPPAAKAATIERHLRFETRTVSRGGEPVRRRQPAVS